MTLQRVSLITLGVADLDRSRAYYRAIGWQEHPRSVEGTTFYQMQGSVLALYGMRDLAADQGRPSAKLGTGAVTLAQNFETEAEVDAAVDRAVAAGGRELKRPELVFWGGYSGYVADPDGHVWEYAVNPFWPLAGDGSLTLPEAE